MSLWIARKIGKKKIGGTVYCGGCRVTRKILTVYRAPSHTAVHAARTCRMAMIIFRFYPGVPVNLRLPRPVLEGNYVIFGKLAKRLRSSIKYRKLSARGLALKADRMAEIAILSPFLFLERRVIKCSIEVPISST